MQPLNDEEEMFFKRIYSIKNNAIDNYKITTLKFLDLRKQEIIKYIIGKDCYLYFDGGYNDSEYKKCIISPFEIDDPDFKITKLKLNYNKKFLSLNHRKVLAVLMDLGIKREVFGDILFNNNDCFIMASSENKDYIINNLNQDNLNQDYDTENELNDKLNLSKEEMVLFDDIKNMDISRLNKFG